VIHSTKKLNKPENDDDSDIISNEDEDKEPGKKSVSKILHPLEIEEHVKLMWKENGKVMDLIFGNYVCNKTTLQSTELGYKVIKFHPNSFFLEVLPVAPNRFRPENKMSDSTYLHQHTVMLQKILTINFELKKIVLKSREKKEAFELKETFSKWIELQDAVNGLFDATKCGKVTQDGDAGIKQLLEKKEGIFRMKIMGKRVNYAARSVISPDPMLDTNEVGVPLFVAKKLTFPEAVNEANIEKLKMLIRNGPSTWPGAIYMTENGKKITLEGSTAEQRESIIKSLLSNAENKVVYRHVMHGDVLLFNRQPTLHKPSLMSHIARVLPREHTIRMHYANCSSYNADFDGDEMNLHLLQNHLARSEAYNLSLSDKQYIVPTNNAPIRGLIQDIILSAVFLTMKGAFFEKSEYFQLIYSSLRTLVEKDSYLKRIRAVPPCIIKPKKLWTGKQIVTTIINIVAEKSENDEFAEKLFMHSKGRINERFLSAIDKEDKQVIIQGNEMLTGILDKAAIGSSTFGLIHCFYELTDSKRTGKLLSGLSRLFSNYLQMHGFTCGLDDLITSPEFETLRKESMKDLHNSAVSAQAKHVGMKDYLVPEGFDLFGRPLFDKPPSHRVKEILKKEADINYLPVSNEISSKLEQKRMEESRLSLSRSGWCSAGHRCEICYGGQTHRHQ
jgi:DNA-directed RNA polymerase I subunit RPA1